MIARHLRRAKGKLSEQTIDDRRKLLYRLDRELPEGLCKATQEELEEWLVGPEDRPWARETRRTYFMHLRCFFRDASNPRRSEHLDYDPTEGIACPTAPAGLPRPATEDQLAAALTRLPAPYSRAVALAAYAGARAAEVAALLREEVTARSLLLHGKGGKDRLVPTHPAVWSRIEHLPPGPIIVREVHREREADGDYVSSRVTVWLGRIGYPELTLHQFRHRFATLALRPREFGGAGASLRTVQELLGHANPAVTARYTAVSERERDVCVAALPMYSPDPS